jgi:hypothetical protein
MMIFWREYQLIWTPHGNETTGGWYCHRELPASWRGIYRINGYSLALGRCFRPERWKCAKNPPHFNKSFKFKCKHFIKINNKHDPVLLRFSYLHLMKSKKEIKIWKDYIPWHYLWVCTLKSLHFISSLYVDWWLWLSI